MLNLNTMRTLFVLITVRSEYNFGWDVFNQNKIVSESSCNDVDVREC